MLGKQIEAKWLDENLSQQGKEALRKICGDDLCLMNTLLFQVAQLLILTNPDNEANEDISAMRRLLYPPENAVKLADIKRVSSESKRFLKDVQNIARKYQKLFDDIERLSWSPEVQDLKAAGMIPPNDLLHHFINIESLSGSFKSLLNPGFIIRKFDNRRNDERADILNRIFSLIKTQTGKYHDKELVEILSDLGKPDDWSERTLINARSKAKIRPNNPSKRTMKSPHNTGKKVSNTKSAKKLK